MTLIDPVPFEMEVDGKVLRFEIVMDHGTHLVVTVNGEATEMTRDELLVAIHARRVLPKLRAMLHRGDGQT
jgi:hypothetical protein